MTENRIAGSSPAAILISSPAPPPDNDHIAPMARAIELAERGRGFVHPNPLVGAVIVADFKIVGEGWHTAVGKPHAEIEAIAAARRSGFDRFSDATLYVTLEPCCHVGRTPPCTTAILDAGFRHVVYALDDPDPRVAGGGQSQLEAAGVRVKRGILREEATEQNVAYLHHRRTGLPWLTWKTARTPDGATSWVPGTRTRITCPAADSWVDELRARSDAIIVGVGTVLADDPKLRVRSRSTHDVADRSDASRLTPPDPWRIVLDSNLRISRDAGLLTNNLDRRTLIFTCRSPEEIAALRLPAEIITVQADRDRVHLGDVMKQMSKRGLIEGLVEAGDTLGRALMTAGYLQRLVVLTAPLTSAPPQWPRAEAAAAADAAADLKIAGLELHHDFIGCDERHIRNVAHP